MSEKVNDNNKQIDYFKQQWSFVVVFCQLISAVDVESSLSQCANPEVDLNAEYSYAQRLVGGCKCQVRKYYCSWLRTHILDRRRRRIQTAGSQLLKAKLYRGYKTIKSDEFDLTLLLRSRFTITLKPWYYSTLHMGWIFPNNARKQTNSWNQLEFLWPL